MKLYFYSRGLLTFVETKRVIAKCFVCGIFLGIFGSVGAIEFNKSISNVLVFRSDKNLVVENNYLRQQLSLISTRADRLETMTKQLNERADNIHTLLSIQNVIDDTVSSLKIARKDFKHRSLVSATQSPAP